jgi:hypothetical protein
MPLGSGVPQAEDAVVGTPNEPNDLGGHPAYAAHGSSGQAIVVVPDLQPVVAVASDDGGVVPLDSAALVPLMAEVIFPAVL